MNENKKCLNCRYCENGVDCDFRNEEIKWLNSKYCEDYWTKERKFNYGFSILDKDDFDEDGHQI